MSLLYDKVVNTVNKPPSQRNDAEIDQLLPWFRKKSDLFQSLHADIVRDIVKNCEFTTCKRDTVIIRQMDKGDCFFIILSGKVAIHINTTLTEEEYDNVKAIQLEEEALVKREEEKGRNLDRSKYGIFVGKIDAGKSFGELALINADCVRNATIIADETTDLLSVGRDLYNRSLKAFQANEFEERKDFVRRMPMFHNWQTRYKKMMAFSLKKLSLKFEDTIVRQGAPVDGIHFIIKGQVKLRVDPASHQNQYNHLYPLGNIEDLEKEKARELLRKEMNLEQKGASDRNRFSYQRRAMPQSDMKKCLKPLELCLVRATDTIGDLEMAMGLSTYSQTVECTEESVVYHLDQRNYDRLIEKRNPGALEMIRDIVHTKLALHFSRLPDDSIPLYRYFLYTLDEKEKDAARSNQKNNKVPQVTEVNIDNLQKGPLVNMYGPGSVFYLIRKRAKEMKIRQQKRGIRDTGLRKPLNFGRARPLVPLAQAANQFNTNTSVQVHIPPEEYEPGGYLTEVDEETRVIHGMDDPYMYDYPEEYYHGEDYVDGPDFDVDEGFDFAGNDSALSHLEERMAHWHSTLGTAQKGKYVVKLHRYQQEDEVRPKPGNKVYVRVRSKPKNVSFISFHNNGEDAASGSPLKTAQSSRSPISSLRLLDFISSDKASDAMSELPDRPQTCPVIQRPKSSSHSEPGHNKKKKRKQYTAVEYQALKAQLRQKQKSFVSLLPGRSNSIM